MRGAPIGVVAALVLGLAGACGGKDSCKPGATQACECEGGATGARTCVADSYTYGPCECGAGAVAEAPVIDAALAVPDCAGLGDAMWQRAEALGAVPPDVSEDMRAGQRKYIAEACTSGQWSSFVRECMLTSDPKDEDAMQWCAAYSGNALSSDPDDEPFPATPVSDDCERLGPHLRTIMESTPVADGEDRPTGARLARKAAKGIRSCKRDQWSESTRQCVRSLRRFDLVEMCRPDTSATTAAGGPACWKVTSKIMDEQLAAAKANGRPLAGERAEDLTEMISKMCIEDDWSLDTRKCVLAADGAEALVACTRAIPEVGDGGDDCESVIGAAMPILVKELDMDLSADQRAEMTRAGIKECEDKKWSPAMKSCIRQARSIEDLDTCEKKHKSADPAPPQDEDDAAPSCAKVADAVISLVTAEMPPDQGAGADMMKEARKSMLQQCEDLPMTPAMRRCAVEAKSVDALSACQ